jgi:hypothetical protein
VRRALTRCPVFAREPAGREVGLVTTICISCFRSLAFHEGGRQVAPKAAGGPGRALRGSGPRGVGSSVRCDQCGGVRTGKGRAREGTATHRAAFMSLCWNARREWRMRLSVAHLRDDKLFPSDFWLTPALETRRHSHSLRPTSAGRRDRERASVDSKERDRARAHGRAFRSNSE